MKLNMWILADRFAQYSTELHIAEGCRELSGFRLLDREPLSDPLPDKVYVGTSLSESGEESSRSVVVLQNNEDTILVFDQDSATVINELLASFEYFDEWEHSLQKMISSKGCLQSIVNQVAEVLSCRVNLTNMDGKILALSDLQGDGPFDAVWDQMRETGIAPLSMSSSPIMDEEGNPEVDFSMSPRLYLHTRGQKYIAQYLALEGELLAFLFVLEDKKKLTRGDCQIVDIASLAITEAIRSRDDLSVHPTSAAIISLIEGQGDEESCARITNSLASKHMTSPYQVVAIRNTVSSDNQLSQVQLCSHVLRFECPNYTFVYGSDVVSLVARSDLDLFLWELNNLIIPEYYAIGISMPFTIVLDLPRRYKQAQLAVDYHPAASGVFHVENLAFPYLIDRMTELNSHIELHHSALYILKAYDQEKGTEYYETLRAYLKNEMNLVATAKELYLHRNTLAQRISRIKQLIGSDLQHFDERLHILLSYYITTSIR